MLLTEKQIRQRVRSHLRLAVLHEKIVTSRVDRLLIEDEKKSSINKTAEKTQKDYCY